MPWIEMKGLSDRNPALDGIRGLAILGVVISHSNVPVFKYGGICGVTLFFVLSGYLISSLLLSERERRGRIDLGQFYLRRALRLLPALVVAVLLGGALAIAAGAEVRQVSIAAGNVIFYVGNLWPITGVDLYPFDTTWSLAMEEQFYLLWPVALILLLQLGRRRAFWVVLAIALADVVYRYVGGDPTDLDWYTKMYFVPWGQAWALLAGCALALAPRMPRVSRTTFLVAFAAMVFVASVPGLRHGLRSEVDAQTLLIGMTVGPVAAALGVLLVASAAERTAAPWLEARPLVFFGWISYGLYLWHGIIDHVLSEQFGAVGVRGLIVGAATTVLAIGVAVLSRVYVEQPFLDIKDRHRMVREEAAASRSPSGDERPDEDRARR